MGVAVEWEPWNWDLWNTPQEPDDDDASRELYRQKIDEAPKAGREGVRKVARKLSKADS